VARLGRFLDVSLPVLTAVVFVILWIYVALAVLTDSSLPADSWDWLSGLELVPAVIAWLALLPLAVFLWAWQAELSPVIFGLVMALLVGWSFLAWSSLVRAVARRRRRSH
jgi:hypothetical protein